MATKWQQNGNFITLYDVKFVTQQNGNKMATKWQQNGNKMATGYTYQPIRARLEACQVTPLIDYWLLHADMANKMATKWQQNIYGPYILYFVAILLPFCCHFVAILFCCHFVAILLPFCCHFILLPFCCHFVAILLPNIRI